MSKYTGRRASNDIPSQPLCFLAKQDKFSYLSLMIQAFHGLDHFGSTSVHLHKSEFISLKHDVSELNMVFQIRTL